LVLCAWCLVREPEEAGTTIQAQPSTKNKEQRTKNKEQRTKHKEQCTKHKEQSTKHQAPSTRNQALRRRRSDKPVSAGHGWVSKCQLDTVFSKAYIVNMKTQTVSTRLSEEELSVLDELAAGSGLDRSGMTRSLVRKGLQQMRLEAAVSAYSSQQVSLGRAAEIGGLSPWDFLAHLAATGTKMQYGVEEFEEDLHAGV
jgi:predicted HTH domain antitoxin